MTINLYFYYIVGENLRTIKLIPEENFWLCEKKVKDLEGLICVERKISDKDSSFSIAEKKRIEIDYGGKFYAFKKI